MLITIQCPEPRDLLVSGLDMVNLGFNTALAHAIRRYIVKPDNEVEIVVEFDDATIKIEDDSDGAWGDLSDDPEFA